MAPDDKLVAKYTAPLSNKLEHMKGDINHSLVHQSPVYPSLTSEINKNKIYLSSATSFVMTGSQKIPPMQSSPVPGRRRRHLKSVSFEPSRDEVYEVENLADLPADKIWYTKYEYDSIKARNDKIVRLVRNGQFSEGDEQTIRGLECKKKEVFRQSKENKFNAHNAVIAEQDRQRSRGLNNAAEIAIAYKAVARICQEIAVSTGASDFVNSANYSNFNFFSMTDTETTSKEKTESTISYQVKYSDVQARKKKLQKSMKFAARKVRRRVSMR